MKPTILFGSVSWLDPYMKTTRHLQAFEPPIFTVLLVPWSWWAFNNFLFPKKALVDFGNFRCFRCFSSPSCQLSWLIWDFGEKWFVLKTTCPCPPPTPKKNYKTHFPQQKKRHQALEWRQLGCFLSSSKDSKNAMKTLSSQTRWMWMDDQDWSPSKGVARIGTTLVSHPCSKYSNQGLVVFYIQNCFFLEGKYIGTYHSIHGMNLGLYEKKTP